MLAVRIFGIVILIINGYLELANAYGMPKDSGLNNRPIIAILAQSISEGLLPPTIKGKSYIAASYVKYMESAGARVVPVTTSMSYQEIEEIFNSVNGVLFPGGAVSLSDSQYFKNAKHFYNLAIAASAREDIFPIWGTCLGFEALANIVAGENVLSESEARDIAMPLNFSGCAKCSRMMRDAPDELVKKLSTEPLTYNFHGFCVTPETFVATRALDHMLRVVSYNTDINGKIFVSTFEGRDYPIYATQWHPERNNFEWFANRTIPHSKDATEVGEYFANFFVNEARKSQHRFKSKETEKKYLIYRYPPVYTGDAGHFEECYIFD